MIVRKIGGKEVKVDITNAKGLDKAPAHKDPYYEKLSKGLYVGLWKSGKTTSWLARYRTKNIDGKLVYKTGVLEANTYAQAVKATAAFAEDADGGKLPSRQEKAAATKGQLTVQQLITEYIEGSPQDRDNWEKKQRKTLKETKKDIGEYMPPMEIIKADRYEDWKYTVERLTKRYVIPHLGDRNIASLGEEDMRQLQSTLLRTVKAETVNRGTANLRSALNYGLSKGYLQQGAFWKNVKLEEEAAPEDMEPKPYLEKDTRTAFLEAAKPPLTAIITCLHMTGCRPSEARRLTVGDVHADGRTNMTYLKLKTYKGNRKTGTPRNFQLAGSRLEFFKGIAKGRDKDEPLFLNRFGVEWTMAQLNKAHNEIRDELKLDQDVVTYCWRHSFIQDLIELEMHTLKIAKLAGTSEKYIRDNYTRGMESNPEELPEL